MIVRDKQSSLLEPPVTYAKIEVLCCSLNVPLNAILPNAAILIVVPPVGWYGKKVTLQSGFLIRTDSRGKMKSFFFWPKSDFVFIESAKTFAGFATNTEGATTQGILSGGKGSVRLTSLY